MDLHALTRRDGLDSVAARISLHPRALAKRRSGEHPLTVDDLDALQREYGGEGFDMVATVRRIAERRRERMGKGDA